MTYQEKLINACQQGNIEAVQNFLRSNEIDINQGTNDGMTPLHYACCNGYINIVQLLLQQEEININSLDSSGVPPIQMAASNRHSDIVKILLQQKNIDIHQPTARPFTFKMTPLDFVCQYGHDDILELLLQHNVNINEKNYQAETPLYIACEKGHESIVERLLKQNNIDVNITNKKGATPLHIACNKGHESIVALLLQHKDIFLNQTEQSKNKILEMACNRGYENIVQMLLQHNEITINRDNNNGEILIAHAIQKNRIHIAKMLIAKLAQPPEGLQPLKPFIFKNNSFGATIKDTCLLELAENYPEILDVLNSVRQHEAKSTRDHNHDFEAASCKKRKMLANQVKFINSCQQGNIEDVQNCLRSNEIDINQGSNDGMTPLHYACCNGHIDIVQLLLQQEEIKINSLDSSGVPPIQMAASRNYSDIVKILLQQKNIDIHQPAARPFIFRMTPLDFACQYGHDDILELLLQHNINIHEKNQQADTPLHIACERGHERIVKQLLQQNNIDINLTNANGATPFMSPVIKDMKVLLNYCSKKMKSNPTRSIQVEKRLFISHANEDMKISPSYYSPIPILTLT